MNSPFKKLLGLGRSEAFAGLPELRERLVSLASGYIILFALPMIIASTVRAFFTEWNWYLLVQIGVYILFSLIYRFRKFLGTNGVSLSIVFCTLLIGVSGVAAWGPAPSRLIVLSFGCLFAGIFLGLRSGLATVFISTVLMCFAARLNGIWGEVGGGDSISSHTFQQWVVTIGSYIVYVSVGTMLVSWVTRALEGAISEISKREDELRVKNELLQHQTVILEESAEELEIRAEALREAKEVAECSSRSKEQFLSIVSHELRTPLNPIIGFADLLEEQENLEPEVKGKLALMKRSANQLLRVINRIVDFSELDQGSLRINRKFVSIGRIRERAEEILSPEMKGRDVSLKISCRGDHRSLVKVDDRLVLQLVDELASNALKFTAKGSVSIEIFTGSDEKLGAFLGIEISDTGRGMTPEGKAHLFDPFVQEDGSKTREIGGVGIGLTICDRVVRSMDGVIKVESELGVGSVFTLRIPAIHQPARSAELAKPSEQTIFDRDVKILIVEDDDINRKVVSSFVAKMGATSVCAVNGKEALDTLEREDFDLVLMDISMPVMDGITATKHIRQNSAYTKLPIIALTAHSFASSEFECYEAGMDAFLTKPVKKKPLFEACNTVMLARSELAEGQSEAASSKGLN